MSVVIRTAEPARAYSPHQSLAPRSAWVAVDKDTVIGFNAGHRARRFNCNGELGWVDVSEEYRRQGIADRLVETMLAWFPEQGVLQVCVNVDPDNLHARHPYTKHVHRSAFRTARLVRSPRPSTHIPPAGPAHHGRRCGPPPRLRMAPRTRRSHPVAAPAHPRGPKVR